MRIGELSKASGLSVHAIRWYESRRLIPAVRRTEAGHREYGEWHIAWLALLDRLKRTGMTIAQMTAYADLVRCGESTLAQQRAMFVEHRERAAADLVARRQALRHIDEKIAFLERWIETGERPPIAKTLRRPKPGRPSQRGDAPLPP